MVKKFFFALAMLPIFIGCAGVGIVSTDDPRIKLSDASVLFTRQDRPLPAEKLIRESIGIYETQNNPDGLARAYREYAVLLTSSAVVRWEKVYRRDGFIDESITFDNRNSKAREYYEKSLSYYKIAARNYRDASKFDALTNVYYNMALIYVDLDDRPTACTFYDHTLEAYRENILQNPGVKPIGNVPSRIEGLKWEARCS